MTPNALSVSEMLLVRYSEIQRLKRAEAILASIWSYAHALRDEHWKECECDLEGETPVCKSPSERVRRDLLALLDAASKETP